MNNRCDDSKILIPNDQRFLDVARRYVTEVAKIIGFEETDIECIHKAVRIAFEWAINRWYPHHQKSVLSISCERVPVGIKITFSKKEHSSDAIFPKNAGHTKSNNLSKSLMHPITNLNKYVDEVIFQDFDPEGKSISLIKHQNNRPITEYFGVCELELYHPPNESTPPISTIREIRVRPMQPSEALEVSRAIYKSYGDSYPYPYVYFPDKLIELNRSGRIHSAVAVTDDNRIAGHCALHYPNARTAIAEMAQGVVKPEFRSQGCFARLTGYLIAKAKEDGVMGIFAQPVTNHTFSQQVGHRFGLKDCALLLSHIPTTISFHGIAESPEQKISVLVQFRYLNRPDTLTGFPPRHHRKMLMHLYQNLGVTPDWQQPAHNELSLPAQETLIKIAVKSPLNLAIIEIFQFGNDLLKRIEHEIKSLSQKRIDIVNLYLNLSNPFVYHYTSKLEKLGFFFAGILPGATQGRDALILQLLNQCPIDFDQIRLHAQPAKDLVRYIRRKASVCHAR